MEVLGHSFSLLTYIRYSYSLPCSLNTEWLRRQFVNLVLRDHQTVHIFASCQLVGSKNYLDYLGVSLTNVTLGLCVALGLTEGDSSEACSEKACCNHDCLNLS